MIYLSLCLKLMKDILIKNKQGAYQFGTNWSSKGIGKRKIICYSEKARTGMNDLTAHKGDI